MDESHATPPTTKGSWTPTDTRYAAATAGALGLVAYLVASNFGLVPSPLGLASGSPAQARALTAAPPLVAVAPSAPQPAAVQVVEGVVDRAGGPPAPTTEPTPAPDRSGPTVGTTTEDGAVLVGVSSEDTVIIGTAADTDSGVAVVTVTFTAADQQPVAVEADLACDAARRQCDWSVRPPAAVGTYDVQATATDGAGNTSASDPISVTVVDAPGVLGDATGQDEGGIVGGLLGTVSGVVSIVGGLLV